MPPSLVHQPWRRPSVGVFLLILILGGLFYTGFTLHDSEYEPTVVHQAVEAVEDAAEKVQHEILPAQAPSTHLNDHSPPDYGDDDFCNTFPDPGNIALIIKTGATELHSKVPTPLSTYLRCVREPIIVSDLEDNLGQHEVHDALANFTTEAMENNKDFDIYRKQQLYRAQGRVGDIPELSETPIPSDDWRTEGKSAAWGLDKYKWLHMIEQSWELAPNRDWYVFIEADTYLSWPNLLRWLGTLDPRRKLYYGNTVRMWEYPGELYFGHGGSGVVLSGSAVKEFAVAHKGLANRWDKRVHKMWFGDFVLAAALFEELRLRLKNAFPSLNSIDPSAVTFTENSWCRPVVTLHHLQAQQLNDLFQLERTMNDSVLLYKDVYHTSFPDGMPLNRTNWSNLADEGDHALDIVLNKSSKDSTLVDPHGSFEECELACSRNEECLEFLYIQANMTGSNYGDESKCHLSQAIRLGEEKEPEVRSEAGSSSEKRWMSGWMKDRIAKWVEEHQSCSISDRSWPS